VDGIICGGEGTFYLVSGRSKESKSTGMALEIEWKNLNLMRLLESIENSELSLFVVVCFPR